MKNTSKQLKFHATAIALILTATLVHGVSAQIARFPSIQTTERLREFQQKQIPIATTIEGTITTPIVWTDNSQSNTTRATITFNEPLLYSDGSIALPESSSLIVEVDDWDDAGFVTLNTVAIIYEDSRGEFTQSAIPEGTLLIRDEDDRPLAFKTEESNGNNSIRSGIFDEAVQTGARNLSLPGGLDSAVSRTIRDNFRSPSRANTDTVYLVEEETTVSIVVNSFLNIED